MSGQRRPAATTSAGERRPGLPLASGPPPSLLKTRVGGSEVLALPRIGPSAEVSPDRRWRFPLSYDEIVSGSTEFLSRDPAVRATRSPYWYVAGNPLNRVDPSGAYDPSQVYCAISSSTDCSNDPLKEVQDTCADDPDGCAKDLNNLNESIRAQLLDCDPSNPALHARQLSYLGKLFAARQHAIQRLQELSAESGGVDWGAIAGTSLKCGVGGGFSGVFTAITGGAAFEIVVAVLLGCGAGAADVPIDDVR